MNLGEIHGIAIYRELRNVVAEPQINRAREIVRGVNRYERVELPFAFYYWGLPFKECYICTNGFLTFESGYSSPDNSFSELKNRFMVAPFWDYLETENNHVRAGPFRSPNRFVVDWETHQYGDSDNKAYFQVVLFSSGIIRFIYRYFEGRYDFTPTVGVGRGPHYPHTFDLLPFNQGLRGPVLPIDEFTEATVGPFPSSIPVHSLRIRGGALRPEEGILGNGYDIYFIWM